MYAGYEWMSETNSTTTDFPRQPQPDTASPGLELLAPLLCLIGLCITVYLTILHYGLMLGDLSLGGVCGGGTWGDCNSVVASRYGKLLGLPVSIWGMWYYIGAGTLSLGILLLRRVDTVAFVRALLWLTVAALLFDAYLAWAMWQRLGRFCPLCAVTYAVNVLILMIAVRCHRRLRPLSGASRCTLPLRTLWPIADTLFHPSDPAYYREVLKLFLAGLGLGGSLLVLSISLIASRAVLQTEQEKLTGLLKYVRRVEPFYVDTAGRPTRGADDAAITLVVFSDFLCEQCKLASEYFDIVAANHRDSMRIVYMNYPMDVECNPHKGAGTHPGACMLARAGECAHQQGRFQQFHDIVFDEPGSVRPEKVTDYATRSGLDIEKFNTCLAEPHSDEVVRADIALGHSVGVTVTPTSYINGRPVVGALKPWMLEAAIEAILPLAVPLGPTAPH